MRVGRRKVKFDYSSLAIPYNYIRVTVFQWHKSLQPSSAFLRELVKSRADSRLVTSPPGGGVCLWKGPLQ
jgi:hypothetical protein